MMSKLFLLFCLLSISIGVSKAAAAAELVTRKKNEDSYRNHKESLFQRSPGDAVKCSTEEGGGFCPAGNTCCSFHNVKYSSSGCIANDISKNKLGVCCFDNDDSTSKTGCAYGYMCDNDENNNKKCVRDWNVEPWKIDPWVETLPRYALCSPPKGSLNVVYGLPVTIPQMPELSEKVENKDIISTKRKMTMKRQRQNDENDDHLPTIPKAIYYSTHGDITTTPSFPNIKMAFIILHGAGRNADDYFCAGTASASLQSTYPQESILVISPRYVTPQDSIDAPLPLSNHLQDSEILKWDDGNKDGTWRYGASPIAPSDVMHLSNLSSYHVMDEFVNVLANRAKFPSLERISVVGHSSGGQFVQRWALTSSSFVWNDDYVVKRKKEAADIGIKVESRVQKSALLRSSSSPSFPELRAVDVKHSSTPSPTLPEIYAIVANPSSYAYLDNRRYVNGKLQVPPLKIQQSCPTYNNWEWGLDTAPSSYSIDNDNDDGTNNNSNVPQPRYIPYVSQAITHAHGIQNLAERYSKRSVVYLIGSVDRCNVTTTHNMKSNVQFKREEYWCDSHGLETLCVDELQGRTRFERSNNYFHYLMEYFQVGSGEKYEGKGDFLRHERWVVDGVGHDHSLMFTSDVGIKAIFG